MGLPRLFENRLNVLAYIALPLSLGLAIVVSDWRYVIGLVAILLFFYPGLHVQCCVLIISFLYPIVVTIGPINELPVSLIVAPLFFVSMLSFMILNGHSIRPGKHSRLFIFALSLLLLCLIVGYTKNSFSIFSIDLGDREIKMVGLAYLKTFAGIMVLFSALWFFSITSFDENRLLRFFVIIATILVLLKFTPLSPILFDSSFATPFITRAGAKRFAFDSIIWLSIPALIAYSSQRVNTLRILLIGAFLTLGVISGGRTLFFGIVFAIIIYLSLFYKKYSSRLVLACAVLILTMALTAQFVTLPTQIKRITGVTLVEEGGFAQQDTSRSILFSYYWDIFLDNPLFGKGIGVYEERIPPERFDFLTKNLVSGGHGAYLSILSTFGIIGAVFLAFILFGTVFKSYKLVLTNSLNQDSVPYQKLAIFIFLYSLVAVFYYVFGYSGLTDMKLYFVIGMLIGILEKREAHTRLTKD